MIKKIIILLSSIFFATTLFAGTISYMPDDKSYEISFPVTWTIMEKDNGATMIALAPKKDNDPFRERVIVNREYVGNNTNVEYYLYNAIEEVKKKYPSFAKENETNVMIDNVYAKEVDYSVEYNGVRVKAKLLLLFTRGHALKFFFLADAKDYPEYRNLFAEIKNSIELE